MEKTVVHSTLVKKGEGPQDVSSLIIKKRRGKLILECKCHMRTWNITPEIIRDVRLSKKTRWVKASFDGEMMTIDRGSFLTSVDALMT